MPEKGRLFQQIAATDELIDKLVYELSPSGMFYGLREEEVGIVEG
jgi:hypothetical protein